MSAASRELRAIAAHLFDRIEEVARKVDPMTLEGVAAEMEGAARVIRRIATEQRREGEPA